jgi:hypothetical protein
MAKLTWVLYNSDASIDFTSSVKYFTYNQGRRSVLDNYGGGTATITMRNNSGQVAAAFLAYRQKVLIKVNGTNAFIGWVQGIDYNDTPGNANDATATITLGDAWVLAGQQIATSQVLTSNDFQVSEIAALQFYPAQFQQLDPSSSIRGSLGYAGDYATRLNQIVASDRGKFVTTAGLYWYYAFKYLVTNINSTFTFGRTASASVIAYQSLDRVKAVGNQTYVNSAQVTPESLATQTATSSQAGVVGQSTITVATLNTTVTDGMNTATWIANSMADPDQQSFSVTCLDIAQTATTNLAYMLTESFIVELAYTPPGGSSTSEWVSMEGVTVRGFPDRTEVDFSLASFTYYRAFILDDTVMGVLDSSRLGY